MDGLDLYVKQRIQNMEDLWNRLYVESEAKPEPKPQPPVMDDYPTTQPVNYQDVPVFSDTEYGPVSTWQSPPVQEEIPASYSYDAYRQPEVRHSGMAHIRDICAQIFQKIKDF